MEFISLALVGLVLLATFLSAWRDWRAYIAYRDQVRAGRAVATSVQSLLSSVLDAETSQRGYILTHNPSYRKPFDRAVVAIPAEINQLRRLTNNSFTNQSDVDDLVKSINDKMSELRETIRLRDSAGFQSALALVLTDRGQNVMEHIRVVGRRITSAQTSRLTALTALATSRGGRSWFISAIGDLVLGAMLVVASFVIMRATRRRDELIHALREDDRILREMHMKAEAAEERACNILESITDGFISFDKDWNINYLNSEAERIFKRPRAELLGKNYWREFPELLGTDIETQYRHGVAAQAALSFETHFADRNAWWEENIYPGKDCGLSVYFRDISERKRMEERSRHSQKLESLGVLAGGVAHDFNNLLTAILGSATLALEELPPAAGAAELLQNIVAASERAAQLTRQMLAYSGRGRFIVEPLDVSAQVHEITALLQATATRNVELVLRLDGSGALIEGDAGQINQLIMNLVINGAEAVGEGGGQVIVSTSVQQLDAEFVHNNMSGDDISPGHYLLLEVHDTGKGMDQATIARIFDPFFTTKFTGRGLGLAAVLGIVRGHKGAIKVYSHPGRGSTFKVFFPLAAEQSALIPAPVDSEDLDGNATVLVVDDEDVVLNMAKSTLERYGYDVLMAANGREAVEVFRQDPNRIALVLLDMTMPVLSGEETLKELKQLRPDVIVIASSGYNEVEALRRFGQGIKGFLQKPYRAAQLAEKVKRSLSSAAAA